MICKPEKSIIRMKLLTVRRTRSEAPALTSLDSSLMHVSTSGQQAATSHIRRPSHNLQGKEAGQLIAAVPYHSPASEARFKGGAPPMSESWPEM
jgi:hypothetical protein